MPTSRRSPWFHGATLAVLALTSSCITDADDPSVAGAGHADDRLETAARGGACPSTPRRFLVGAGARVALVDDAGGDVLATVDLSPHEEDPRPFPIVALAASGPTFVALRATPDDEGGLLYRGVITSRALGAVAAGWTSNQAHLGAIGDDIVLFQHGDGGRWRFVTGVESRRSLACPVPSWLQATPSPGGVDVVGAASPQGGGAARVLQVRITDDELVACTIAPALPLPTALPDDVIVHTFGPEQRLAVATTGSGLVLLTEQVRAPLPGAFVAGAVADRSQPRVFLLVGDPGVPGVTTVVAATSAGVSAMLDVAGEVDPAPALDRLLPLPHGVAVATSTGVTRLRVGSDGALATAYRIETSAPAHLAPAPPPVVSESLHDR